MKAGAEEAILQLFSEVIQEMGLGGEFDTRNVLVTEDVFAEEAMGQAVAGLSGSDGKAIVERFSGEGLWRIARHSTLVVVFFVDEEAKRIARGDGGFGRIREACFDVAKQCDEFGYLTRENFRLEFDSKERLDRKFEGSLFYYFR